MPRLLKLLWCTIDSVCPDTDRRVQEVQLPRR